LRIRLCSLAAVLVAGPALAADTDRYPSRPIRFLVPNPPGGANDVLSRILGQKLSDAMGQPVIIDNRPGGAGILATELVARAVPDGHTLLLGFNGNLAFTPALRRTPYDPLKDFSPVALVADSQYLMVAHNSVPNSLKAFVAYAKSRPGQINYSTAGSGSPSHLAVELFKQAAGINLVHVAYNGGAPAATAVMSGEAQLFVGSVPVTLPHVRAGRLHALGVTGLKRSAIAAEIPTIAEAGYPGFEVSAWYGVMVPARTPNAIIARLNAEILKLLRLPDAIEQMRRQGLDATGSTPEQFAAHIAREVPKWASVVKNAGIKAD